MIFKHRPARLEDRQFIVSGWSASFRMTEDLPFISMEDYATVMHSQIGKMLDRAGAQTIVVEGSVLAGFICFERDARIVVDDELVTTDYVHYIYVARPFRRQGLARWLFHVAGIEPDSRFYYAGRTSWSKLLRGKVPLARKTSLYSRFTPEENERHAQDHEQRPRRKGRYRRVRPGAGT